MKRREFITLLGGAAKAADHRVLWRAHVWLGGRTERASEIADEFVRLKVDVIVTHATAPVLAAKQATSVIPIVFAAAADPVGAGLVASLARPGGNVTGLSNSADRSCWQAPRTLA